jgi:hypothetical protein
VGESIFLPGFGHHFLVLLGGSLFQLTGGHQFAQAGCLAHVHLGLGLGPGSQACHGGSGGHGVYKTPPPLAQ